MNYSVYINLLQLSLETNSNIDINHSDWDWQEVHSFTIRQSLVGIIYKGMSTIPESKQPAKDLLLRWNYEVECIAGINKKMNAIAAQLTQFFENNQSKSVVLKGQANASLYPNPFFRQSGDIDIWVEGGQNKAISLLSKLHVIEQCKISSHDILIPKRIYGIPVEIHFKPCSGNRNPFSNRRLQHFLDNELKKPFSKEPVSATEFFCKPSIVFSLVMQLSHIQRHFLTSGIGLRQFVDYFYLLKSSSKEDRDEVSRVVKKLNLEKIAAALMWVLNEHFLLNTSLLLCKPNPKYGKILLNDAMKMGDFALSSKKSVHHKISGWLQKKLRLVWLLRFNFTEVFWQILLYWSSFLFILPSRLRYLFFSSKKKTYQHF